MADADKRGSAETATDRRGSAETATDRRGSAETATDWRGVANEEAADVSAQAAGMLKARNRALLWDLLRPYRRLIWVLVVVVLVENVTRLAPPWLVQRGIDLGIRSLLDTGSGRVLVEIVTAMLAALVVQVVTRVLFLRISGRVGQNLLLELRRRVFMHFQKLDVAFHDRYTSGRVISRMTNDTDAISDLMEEGFDGLVSAVLTLIGTGVMLLVMDWRLGLICLASLAFVSGLIKWFSNESSRTFRKVRNASAAVIMHFTESMAGIRAVQAFRREPRNQEIFTELSDRYRAINVRSFRIFAIFMPGIRLIGNVTIGLMLLIGGWFVIEGWSTVGVLTAFLLYLRQFFEPLTDIGEFYNTFQSASAALEKLSGVLDERPGVPEPEDPAEMDHAEGRVDLDHVRFEYAAGRPVLPDLDLHVPAGQTVALVGTTGAGKTTIAKLIARFYDPTSGRVTLDGVGLDRIGDDDLRRAVVMVTQENFIFNGTIADNIAFGRPGASRDQIEEAARTVGAHEFITAMPEGYDTDVSQRGGRLSAGQRQLVAFARAFLADPAVLILDEATSSLDIPSERLVQRALRTILADRTAVIIAHRLSTVENADRVLVLEHGQILEDGAPDELRRRGGRYADLHRSWEESVSL